jgi:hypothetical protein
VDHRPPQSAFTSGPLSISTASVWCHASWSAVRSRTPCRACKPEDAPALRITRPHPLYEITRCVRPNDLAPEREPGPVRFRDAHDPVSRHAVPKGPGRLPTYARTTIPAKDEELRHVEVFWIVARWRPARCEGKASHPSAALDQKRVASCRLRPIERQCLVPEATVRPELDRKDLAQIVDVQLQ